MRWRTLIRGALDRIGRQLGAELPDGSPALRTGIAAWLSTSRGLAIAPDQVVIVNGRHRRCMSPFRWRCGQARGPWWRIPAIR